MEMFHENKYLLRQRHKMEQCNKISRFLQDYVYIYKATNFHSLEVMLRLNLI